jgi:uncharacterized cupin superfamily protein
MIEEAKLEDRGNGLVAAGQGWFVMNARDARWFEQPGRRYSLPLTGTDEYEAETFFPMLGMALRVLEPGAPMSAYHWETEAEDFLVLAGTPLLVVEGQERQLKLWDFVHCPPGVNHVLVGGGDGPSVILAASSRQFQKDGPWGEYTKNDVAAKYGASPPETTQDGAIAYRDFPNSHESRYKPGWLERPFGSVP